MRRTDRHLLVHLDALRSRERTTCVEILLDLVKVEQRKLHISLGYSSLFAFATRHLRYSESAAGRRVQAARCVRDHPEVIPLLRRGVVNLSTISLASRILTSANKKALLAKVAGRTQREVEAIVAQHEPPRPVRDRIRPVSVPRVEHNDARMAPTARVSAGTAGTKAPAVRATTPEDHSRSGNEGENLTNPDHGTEALLHRLRTAPEPGAANTTDMPPDDSRRVGSSSNDAETRFKIQFAAGAEFVRKFEEARALLSGRFPGGASIESVFEAGLDAFLERNSPARRNERRKTREAQRAAKMAQRSNTQTVDKEPAEPCADEAADQYADHPLPQRELSAEKPGKRSAECSVEQPVGELAERRVREAAQQTSHASRRRAVPAAVRDAIFERDDGCCTFVGVDGQRCGSRHDVEIDHCKPVARGGTNTVENLRLLCAAHNRLEAERVFGAAWMQHFGRS